MKGEPVTAAAQVRRGQILLAYSLQFDAENIMRVIEPEGFSTIAANGFYAHFVDPDDTDEARNGSNGPMRVWDFEIGTQVKLWRAERAPAFPAVQS